MQRTPNINVRAIITAQHVLLAIVESCWPSLRWPSPRRIRSRVLSGGVAGQHVAVAVKDEAKILRIVNGQQQIFTVGMEETLQPDDIIIVPESFF